MPKNKNQRKRIFQIDERLNRFGNGSYVSTEELMNICNVSRSTLMNDIQYMRLEFGAPIEYSYSNKKFFYNSIFQISSHLPLSKDDIQALKLAAKTFSQFKNIDAFKNISGIIERIEKAVKFKLDPILNMPIYFENVPYYGGTELVDIFLAAIINCQEVQFQYRSYKTKELYKPVLRPYAIKEHTNRWYVVGFDAEEKNIVTLAFDRIQKNSLKVLDLYFERDPEFNLEVYFQNVLGMTVNKHEEPQDIILSFSELQAQYFKSKPFHTYEVVENSKNKFVVKMKLIPNYELIRKLAGMGNGIRVISPQSLKDKLCSYLKEALEQY